MRSTRGCFLVMFLWVSVATAAEPVSIKPMLSPGTRWSFDGTSTARLDDTASLNGQSQPVTINTKQRRVGKAEVVSAVDGVVTALRVTFDEASSDETTVSGNAQQTPFPYAGKTITITRGAGGAISDDFSGEAAPAAVADLHGLLDTELVFLPTKPVAVGEEWSADPAVLARMLQLSGDDRAGMTLKLLGIKTQDNRDVAEVKVSTVAMRRQDQMQVHITMQGTALIDLKTGHAVKSDLTGTIENKGEQPGPGANGEQASYHVEGTGTLSSAMAEPLVDPGTLSAVAGTATMSGAEGAADANPLGSSASNPLGVATDPFAGKFSDGKLTVDGATRDGKFIASLSLGEQKYPATATIDGHSLSGSFKTSAGMFPFTATLDGDVMTLLTGGKTYALKRAASAAPVNPLGASDASPALPKLPGYAVVVSTDGGKTLTAHKDAASVSEAFKKVFPELANYFDDRPVLVGAFEDTRDHKSGTATFTAHLNGTPVRGIVACQLGEQNADIAVTYCRSDADQAQWTKLLNADASGASVAPAMTVYQFPDNTGSISLASGWTTQAQSDLAPIIVKGPADQTITMGANLSVLVPDSQILQMQRQNDAWMIHINGKPLPHAPQLIAPFCGPAEAMTALIPQLAAMAPPGQPKISIDHVQEIQQLQPFEQGGRAAVVTYNVMQTDAQGQQKHFRASSQIQCSPPRSNGGWMVNICEASAPTESFDHDLPIMLAMMRSKGENAQVCQQITSNTAKAMSEAQQAQFEAGQQAHRNQMAAYDAQNKAWARNEYQKDRNNADFIEVIRGERAIVDTTTGSKGYADLSDAGKIADDLNAHDPGRYKELPLRDELYPVAPGAQ